MLHLLFLGFLYFLPTVIATRRGHDLMPILLLNFFFGWTVIGWFVMLFWALCSHAYPPGYYYHSAPPPPPPGPYYDPNHPYWRRY